MRLCNRIIPQEDPFYILLLSLLFLAHSQIVSISMNKKFKASNRTYKFYLFNIVTSIVCMCVLLGNKSLLHSFEWEMKWSHSSLHFRLKKSEKKACNAVDIVQKYSGSCCVGAIVLQTLLFAMHIEYYNSAFVLMTNIFAKTLI